MGIERTLIALEEEGRKPATEPDTIYLARGAGLGGEALRLARRLRARFSIVLDLEERGLGPQLKQADRIGARVALILGEDEAKAGEVTLKDLTSGEQRRVREAELESALEHALRGPVART
jgi:histidyl-tRNA synthetase